MRLILGILLLIAGFLCSMVGTAALDHQLDFWPFQSFDLALNVESASAVLVLVGAGVFTWGLVKRNRQTSTRLIMLCGGLMMFGSMFFRFVYGPWGAELSTYSLLSHSLSWESWPIWVNAWPVGFGLVQAFFAALSLAIGQFARRRPLWIIDTLLIGSAAVAKLLIAILSRGGPSNSTWFATAVPILVLLLLLLIALGFHRSDRRADWASLVGCGWILVSLWPVSDWTPLEIVLWAYGLGYWLLVAGTLMLISGNVRDLCESRMSTGQDHSFGNGSGLC